MINFVFPSIIAKTCEVCIPLYWLKPWFMDAIGG